MDKNVKQPEVWKPIKGYEGLYEVSNLGNVKTLSRKVPIKLYGGFWTVSEKLLKQCSASNYSMIGLSKNGVKKRVCVHFLVASHFVSNSKGLLHVNHKDEDKLNNSFENLEWVSVRENKTYSIDKRKTSSSYTGVYKKRSYKKVIKWGSCICYKGKTLHLGYFDTEIAAHEAYLSALKKYKLNNKYATLTKNQLLKG